MPNLSPVTVAASIVLCMSQALAQVPPAEARSVAETVLFQAAWVAESSRCPSEFVGKAALLSQVPNPGCGKGELGSCLSKCAAGQAAACYWLGHGLHREGADQQAAEVLYQQACKLGVASGCTNRAAGMLKVGLADPSTQRCAVRTFSTVCALGDPWACTMYALHLSRGLGVKRDPKLALEVLGKSCKYGPEDEACQYGNGLKKQILESLNTGQQR
jgi:hypothetical protein